MGGDKLDQLLARDEGGIGHPIGAIDLEKAASRRAQIVEIVSRPRSRVGHGRVAPADQRVGCLLRRRIGEPRRAQHSSQARQPRAALAGGLEASVLIELGGVSGDIDIKQSALVIETVGKATEHFVVATFGERWGKTGWVGSVDGDVDPVRRAKLRAHSIRRQEQRCIPSCLWDASAISRHNSSRDR